MEDIVSDIFHCLLFTPFFVLPFSADAYLIGHYLAQNGVNGRAAKVISLCFGLFCILVGVLDNVLFFHLRKEVFYFSKEGTHLYELSGVIIGGIAPLFIIGLCVVLRKINYSFKSCNWKSVLLLIFLSIIVNVDFYCSRILYPIVFAFFPVGIIISAMLVTLMAYWGFRDKIRTGCVIVSFLFLYYLGYFICTILFLVMHTRNMLPR